LTLFHAFVLKNSETRDGDAIKLHEDEGAISIDVLKANRQSATITISVFENQLDDLEPEEAVAYLEKVSYRLLLTTLALFFLRNFFIIIAVAGYRATREQEDAYWLPSL
ncbi:hypothetical protein ACJX0J_022806, partial [Zea mays]